MSEPTDLTTDNGATSCPKCGAPMSKNLEGDLVCKACTTVCTSDSAMAIRHDAQWAVSADDMADAELLGYVKKFTKDSNGFLRGQAPVTSIGVFSYMLPNGTVRRELRLPGEVFAQDSLNSLRMVPLTNEHPAQGVSPATASDLQKGTIGDGVLNDAYKIYAPICVTDSSLIAEIEDGKRAISCGYTCDLEDKAGVWNGVAYDAIQRNIRYNHVAIVTRGRAGDDAVLKLDSAQPYQMYRIDGAPQVTKPELVVRIFTKDFNKNHSPTTGQFTSGGTVSGKSGGATKLPKNPKKLNIGTATTALKAKGYTLGRGQTSLENGQFTTSYHVTGPNGKTSLMTAAAIKKLLY